MVCGSLKVIAICPFDLAELANGAGERHPEHCLMGLTGQIGNFPLILDYGLREKMTLAKTQRTPSSENIGKSLSFRLGGLAQKSLLRLFC